MEYRVKIALVGLFAAIAPFAVAFAGCLHGKVETAGERERRVLAVDVARTLNTAEMRHYRQLGAFAQPTQLPRSPALSQWRTSTSPMAITFRRLSLQQGTEVIPGFALHFTTDGTTNYSFILEDTTDQCRFSLFSDQRGVIFQGQELGARQIGIPEEPLSDTAVRLKLEENQLVDVFCEIGVLIDGLKGA